MATYYWVGGTGTWDATSTTNWSLTSGGSGDAGVPTSVDNVIFDAGSNLGTGTFTVSIGGTTLAPSTCADFSTDGAGGALDGTMTLSMSATSILDCYGSMTLPATNFIWSGLSGANLRFVSTVPGNTITTNGVTLTAMAVTFNGVGGEWTLGSDLTTTTNGIQLTAGSFVTNNYNVNVGTIVTTSNALVRSISLGSSTVTLTATVPMSIGATTTNLTFNAGSSTIVCSAATATFAGGGLTFNNVTFSSSAAGTISMTGANTFFNLTMTSPSATGLRQLTLGADIVIIGTITLGLANQHNRRITVSANNNAATPAVTLGAQRIIDAFAVASLSDVDFRDIRIVGDSAPWSGTRLGNAGNNNLDSITFDAPKSVWWSLAAGGSWQTSVAWALTNGGTPSTDNVPLAQDTAYITDTNLNAGATITMDNNWWLGTVDWSGRTLAATFAFSSLDPQCYGDFILSSSVTHTGVSSPSLAMYGQNKTQILNSAGVTLALNVLQFWNPGGGTVLAGNTTVQLTAGTSGTTQHVGGTFDLAGYTFSTVFFNSSQVITRTLAFGNNGKIVVTGNTGTAWSTAAVTGLTVTGTGTAPLVEFDNAGTIATRRADFGPAGEANSINVTWINGGGIIDQRTTNSAIRNLRFEDAVTATLTVNAALLVYGDLYIGSGLTATTSNANSITMAATGGTKTITTNAKTINFNLGINAPGATVVLGDALTVAPDRTITFTSGTFTPGQNITVGNFVTTVTGTKVLNMGSTIWTLSGTAWNIGSASVLTFNAGTSEITATGATAGVTFTGGGLTYYDVSFASSPVTVSLLGANTFNNLTFVATPSTGSRNLLLDSNIIVNGTFTISGTSITQTVYVLSNPYTAVVSITASAISSLSYIIFRGITALGAAIPWSGTGLGNGGGNTNITFAAPKTVYWNQPAGGVWTDTAWATTPTGTPSSANNPLPQDTAIFTNAGLNNGSTITMNASWQMPGIDFSAVTNSVTFDCNSFGMAIYGNIILSATTTIANTGGGGTIFPSQYSGTQIITSAGQTFPIAIGWTGPFAVYQLTDTLTTTLASTLSYGTINLNGQTHVCQFFASSVTTTRSINFNSGKIQVTGNNATVWSMATVTNFSYTGTSLVEFTYSGSVGTRTITTNVAGTVTNAAMNFRITAGTDIVALGGSNIGCGTLDFTGTPGFTGTLSNLSRNILGDLTLNPGMTVASGTGITLFIAPGGTQTLTSAGVLWQANFNVANIATTVALADNLTLDSARSFTLSAGTVLLNNNTLSTGIFNSTGAVLKSVQFGTGKIQVTGNNATVVSLGTVFTNTGSRLIELTYAGSVGTRTVTLSTTGESNQWNISVVAGTDTVTTTGSSYFNNLDFTGFSGTFANVIRYFYGNLTLSPTMTVAGGTVGWNWVGLAKTTKTLTTNGIVVDVPITIAQGTDSVLSLGDSLTMTADKTLIVTSGTFTTNNQAMSVGLVSSSGTGVRTVNLGSSAVTVNGTGGTVWNLATTTNLTFSAGTSTITFNGSGGGVTAQFGGLTYNNVVMGSAVADDILTNFNILGTNTFNNLTLTAPTVPGRKAVVVFANQTVTGTMSSVGATAVNRVCVITGTGTVAYTITAANVNFAQTEFRGITAEGTSAPWTGVGLGDQGDNTNIVFAPAKIVYWSSLGGGDWGGTVWALASGGTPDVANFPLPQDTAIIDNTGINSGSVISLVTNWSLPALTCSGLINDITIAHSQTADICGNWVLENVVSFVGAGTLHFAGTAMSVASNGAIFSQLLTATSAGGGSVTLLDNLTTTESFRLGFGTLNLNSNILTCAAWTSSSTDIRELNFGTGQIVISGNDAIVFNMSTATGFSYTGTPTVNFTYGGVTGTRTIQFGTLAGATEANVLDYNILAGGDIIALVGLSSYGSVNFTGFAGTKILNNGNLTFYRNLTWTNVMIAEPGAGSIIFAGGATQTMTTNGLALDFPLQVNKTGGVAQLGDNLTMGNTRTFTLLAGTFNANNYNLSTGLFNSSGTLTRTLNLGNGQWTLTGTGTVWNITDPTSLTLTAGASTVNISSAFLTTVTFAGGGLTYNNFIYDPNSSGSGNRTLQITGVNTWNNFTSTGVPSSNRYAILLGNSQTITNTLTLTGTNEYSRVYFSAQSSASGIANVIAGAVTLNYADFKGITAGGAAIPWTGTSLGDMGGNTNITFAAPKTVYWNQPAGGVWTDPAWALTSGGATSLANFPLAQDTVIFNNTGANPGITVTLSGDFQIGTFNCSALTNAILFDLTIGQAFNGDVTLSSAVTVTGGSFNFNYPNKIYNFTQSGATVSTNLIMGTTNISSTLNLVDTFTLSDSSTFNFVRGTLNLNGQTLTTGLFNNNNSNPRTIAFAGGQINLTGNDATVWDGITLTNFSYTGTSVVNLTYAGSVGTRYVNHGKVDGSEVLAVNFNVTAGSDIVTIEGSLGTVNYTGFTGTATLNIRTYYGDLIIPAGIATTGVTSQVLTFAATSGTQTINVVPALPVGTGITIAAPGATVQLGADLVLDVSRTLTLTSGTFNTQNYNITTGSVVATGDVARILNLGSSTVTVLGTTWNLTDTTASLTFNAGTSTIIMSGTAPVFTGNGLTYYNLTTNNLTQLSQILGANTFNNLTVGNSSAISGTNQLILYNNQIVTGTLTLLSGSDASSRLSVSAFPAGTAVTVTAATVAALTDITFKDITASGTSAPWSGTRLGNAGNNTNIAFATGVNKYWSLLPGGSWTATAWATTSGGTPDATNFPLPQDTVIFDDAGLGSLGQVTMPATQAIGTLNFSARTVPMTLSMSTFAQTLYGNLILDANAFISGTGGFNFAGSGATQTMTSNGVTLVVPITVTTGSSTAVQLVDACDIDGAAFTLTSGTLNLNNQNLIAGTFTSSNTNVRTLNFGTGQITVRGSGVTIFNVTTDTNLTVLGTPVVNCTYAGFTGTRVVEGGGTISEANSISINITGGGDIFGLFGSDSYRNVNFTGFSGTLQANSATRIIYGDLTLSSDMTWLASTGTTAFQGTAGTYTITTNGVTVNAPIEINAPGGTYRLGSTWTQGTAYDFTLTAGTFNTQNYNLTTRAFLSSNTNVRAVNLGSSTWTLAWTGSIVLWNIQDSTNMTLTAGTSSIVFDTPTNGTVLFYGGGLTYYNFTLVNNVSIFALAMYGTNTFNNVTVNAPPIVGRSGLLPYDSFTVTGTLTVNGNSPTQNITLGYNLDSPVTITAAAISMSYVTFRYITAGGASIFWSGTGFGDAGNNQNIIFDPGRTVYWSLPAGGNWSADAWAATSGGTPDPSYFPLAQDTAVFDNTGWGVGSTLAIDGSWNVGGFNASTLTNAMLINLNVSASFNLYGNITFSSAITTTGTSTSIFLSGTQTVDFAGVPISCYLTKSVSNTTTTLLNNVTVVSAPAYFRLAAGTVDLNGFDITCPIWGIATVISATRAVAFNSGTIRVTGNDGTVWNAPDITGFSYTGTPTVNFTYAGGTGTRFIQNGITAGLTEANSVDFNILNGSDNVTLTGPGGVRNLTFANEYTGRSNLIGGGFIYGNLRLSPNQTLTVGSVTTFAATSGTRTIETNNLIIGSTLNFDGIGGTWQLIDSLNTLNQVSLISGTFDTNNQTVSCGKMAFQGDNVKVINMGSSSFYLGANSAGTASAMWDLSTSPTNLTVNAGTSTIYLQKQGVVGTQAFYGGGFVYNNLVIAGNVVPTQFLGSGTFNNLSNTVTPLDITFEAGQTITTTDWNINGVAGQQVTLASATPGSQWNLAKSGGGYIVVYYCTISDSAAAPGTTWYAPTSIGYLT